MDAVTVSLPMCDLLLWTSILCLTRRLHMSCRARRHARASSVCSLPAYVACFEPTGAALRLPALRSSLGGAGPCPCRGWEKHATRKRSQLAGPGIDGLPFLRWKARLHVKMVRWSPTSPKSSCSCSAVSSTSDVTNVSSLHPARPITCRAAATYGW